MIQKFLIFTTLILTGMSIASAKITNEELMQKGMWQDPKTGLIWDRCSIGQTWNGTTCTGEAAKLIKNQDDLGMNSKVKGVVGGVNHIIKRHRLGGYNDWQLPTVVQLSTIVSCDKGFKGHDTVSVYPYLITRPNYRSKRHQFTILDECSEDSSSPSINLQIFPNTPKTIFWAAKTGNNYWFVNFDDGKIGTRGFGVRRAVQAARAVRLPTSLGLDSEIAVLDARLNTEGRTAVQEKEHLAVLRKEREAEKAKAAEKAAKIAAEKAREDAERKRLEQIAYDKKTTDFRKTLAVGDYATAGMVIEIKGNLVQVQSNESQCTQKDYNNDCINWIKTPTIKWVKRDNLYPNKY